MAASCTLRSSVPIASLNLRQLSYESRIKEQALPAACVASSALSGRKSLPQTRATSISTFASSRQLLGATAVPTVHIKTTVPTKRGSKAHGGALASQAAYPVIFGLAPDTLQWIFSVASTALLFRLLPPVSHALLVPALFLNLPARVIEAIKSEAGAWVAVAVLVLRLFTALPKYVDLPLAVLLSILVAPYELLSFRGTQGAGIVTLAIG